MRKRQPRLGDFVFATRFGGGATHAGVLISRTDTQARLEGRYDTFLCEAQVIVVEDATIPEDLREKVRAVRQRLVNEGAMPASDLPADN